MRNPDWVRDEVILALDLYFHAGRKQLPASHPEVIGLSELLGKLPFHDRAARDVTFRNTNGISMILGNFLGIDPLHHTPGLSRNNHLQQDVWDYFAGDDIALRRTAKAIVQANENGQATEPFLLDEEDVFPEGEILTHLHLARERNQALVQRKKRQVLRSTGRLACEVCDFDFADVYGELGKGFAACHHRLPLSECANCHRMLHRSRPLLSVEGLRSAIKHERGTAK